MTTPHPFLKIVRPDEAAECWEGITAVPGLYEALWGCVGAYEAPLPEVSEEPCYGMDNIAGFWDRFSDEHKAALNTIAAERDAEFNEPDYDDGQPDEAQEWYDFDPDC